jgi:hypothetical protein
MKKIILAIILIAAGLNACKKLATADFPTNQLTNEKVFNDTTSLSASVAGMFTQLGTVDANLTRNIGLYTDELKTTSISASNSEFSNSNLTVNNSSVLSIWQNLYNTIYKANAIIEAMQSSTSVPLQAKNSALGESRFIRGYCYLMLTRLYGDVPLILSTDAQGNALKNKSAGNQVLAQCIGDFDAASHLLTSNYPLNNGKTTANKYGALGYLSQTCLESGQYMRADSAASALIASDKYKLLTDLSKVCTQNNDEAIFQLWNQNGFSTLNMVTLSGVPTNQLTSTLINSFTNDDQRKNAWIGKVTSSGTIYYFPLKYRQRSVTSGPLAEYTTYLRLAEVYLIRAEARANINNLSGAQNDMNIIRTRAGLTNLALATKSDITNAILHERQLELFSETGSRFFDLKRFGTLDQTLKLIKPQWKSTGIIFPIPQTEILNDPNLIQNSGY